MDRLEGNRKRGVRDVGPCVDQGLVGSVRCTTGTVVVVIRGVDEVQNRFTVEWFHLRDW